MTRSHPTLRISKSSMGQMVQFANTKGSLLRSERCARAKTTGPASTSGGFGPSNAGALTSCRASCGGGKHLVLFSQAAYPDFPHRYIVTTIDLDRNFFGMTAIGYPLAPLPVKYLHATLPTLMPAILVPATPALPVKPEHGTNHHAAGVVAMPGSSSNVPRPPHQGLFGAFMGGV